MARFRTIAAFSVVTGACILAAMPTASGQTAPTPAAAPLVTASPASSHCPKSADQYALVMRLLASSAARARTLAVENPLFEPDAAYFAHELAAIKTCTPTLATLSH
jgi:hypothetical protein